MKRIGVVGPSGSGKTTVGSSIAVALGLPHLELDAVFHQPNWTPLPEQEFHAVVDEFTGGEGWVIDGNYSVVADLIWGRADTIVWLDLPPGIFMSRLVWRTVTRGIRRTELWNGNRENLRNLVRRDPERNVVAWAWTRRHTLRERYEGRMSELSHLDVHRLRSRSDVRSFLDETRRHRRYPGERR